MGVCVGVCWMGVLSVGEWVSGWMIEGVGVGVWVWGLGLEEGMGVETPARHGLKKGVQTWVQMHGWATGLAPPILPHSSTKYAKHRGVLTIIWSQGVPMLWASEGTLVFEASSEDCSI